MGKCAIRDRVIDRLCEYSECGRLARDLFCGCNRLML